MHVYLFIFSLADFSCIDPPYFTVYHPTRLSAYVPPEPNLQVIEDIGSPIIPFVRLAESGIQHLLDFF
jgi:hypothetical protein